MSGITTHNFRPKSGHLSVTLSVRTALCMCGIAYRRVLCLAAYVLFTKSLRSPLCGLYDLEIWMGSASSVHLKETEKATPPPCGMSFFG